MHNKRYGRVMRKKMSEVWNRVTIAAKCFGSLNFCPFRHNIDFREMAVHASRTSSIEATDYEYLRHENLKAYLSGKNAACLIPRASWAPSVAESSSDE